MQSLSWVTGQGPQLPAHIPPSSLGLKAEHLIDSTVHLLPVPNELLLRANIFCAQREAHPFSDHL